MTTNSIRFVLLAGINGLLLLLLGATALASYYSSQHEMDELYDAQMAQYARAISHLLNSHIQNSDSPGAPIEAPAVMEDFVEKSSADERQVQGHKYEAKLGMQIWTSSGQLLQHSANVGETALLPMVAGYHLVRHQGNGWIGFAMYNTQLKLWIFTAQRQDVRDELSMQLAMSQLLPMAVVMLPMLVLV